MSALTNDAGTLRFVLTPAGEGLASAAMEFFDARDKGFWPLVQLPVVNLPGAALEALARMAEPVAQRKTDSFAWRGGAGEELALSVVREADAWIVEVGIDLSAYLRETARVFVAPQRELALFRFHATAEALSRFASELVVAR